MRALPKPSVAAILVMAAALSLWKLTAVTAHQAEETRGILMEAAAAMGGIDALQAQEKILFQSDLFVSGSPLPLQTGARELLRAIQQQHLKVERLAGGHGPVGSFEELRKAAGELM